jgi:hypothetical protein
MKTKAKRNQREIENGRKNNRGLNEIKLIFTITMLDYFPHMSAFHQERTGFVTIEKEYYASIRFFYEKGSKGKKVLLQDM